MKKVGKREVLKKGKERGKEGGEGQKLINGEFFCDASSFPSHESRLPVGCMLSPLISANLPQCSSHLSLRTAWVFLGIEHRT